MQERCINMQEMDIEQYLVKEVKKQLKGRAFKLICPGVNGMPDRMILYPIGKIVFVETKAPKKTPRKLQKECHRILRNLGFEVYVIDTKEKVDQLILELGSDKGGIYTPRISEDGN